jgi:hypothetical protein
LAVLFILSVDIIYFILRMGCAHGGNSNQPIKGASKNDKNVEVFGIQKVEVEQDEE